MRVDFFVIGAPKCGTTSFCDALARHPEICFSRPKEPHFFYRTPLCPAPETNEAYSRECFPHFDPNTHRACGEGTPRILESAEALDRVLETFPDARFLVLVRDPLEMFFSWHGEMLRSFQEDVRDPVKAWRLCGARREGRRVPASCRDPRNLAYDRVCALGSHLDRVMERLDRSRVLVVETERVRTAPGDVLAGTWRFLGVSAVGPSEISALNTARALPSETALTWARRLYGWKCRMLGDRPLPFGLNDRARALLFRRETDRGPSAIPPVEMEAFFEGERERLRSCLSRNG